jgi:hypothetical protein
MTTAQTARRKAARRGRRSSVGDDPVRLAAPRHRLMAAAGQRRDARSARPAIVHRPAARGRGPILFPPTMPAAAKSP